MIQNLDELQTWLATTTNREHNGDYSDWKLDRARALVARLPAPPRPITVCGTKGKGSVVAMLAAIARCDARPAVAFTSPHVHRLNERWLLDGQPVDDEHLLATASRIQALEGDLHPSWFERTFAIATLLAVDLGGEFLCEVGLGGRLDCANLLDARLVVCTHLSRDHGHILGHTVAEIAREKLAICRNDAPLVVAPQSAAGKAAIVAAAPCTHAIHWPTPADGLPAEPAMPGAHQRDNAAAAAAAARLAWPDLNESALATGLSTATLPGRCQILTAPDGRRWLIDGAHNGASIAATRATARTHLRPGFATILASAADKHLDDIAQALEGLTPLYRCAYNWPRCATDTAWPEPLRRRSPWHPNLTAALAACPPDQDICITGSLYLAGEALTLADKLGLASWPLLARLSRLDEATHRQPHSSVAQR